MSEEGKQTSRREFLGKALRTTGYVLPLIVAVKASSRKAWAQQYGNDGGTNLSEQQSSGNGSCNSTMKDFSMTARECLTLDCPFL
jgi:hypothetical protein